MSVVANQNGTHVQPVLQQDTQQTNREPIVLLDSVHKSYRQGSHTIEALAGVNLQVPRGTIQGIIGFSGAGKSTLLRCISRIEKPDSGRVTIAGTDLTDLEGDALRKARRQIGVVFQHLNLLRSRTVADNVGLGLELAGHSKADIQNRVAELLDWFGLKDKARQYPSQLSGGQQQRVAIARALAMRPAVLLTDEPTSALDPETTASVLNLLRQIREDFQVTILLITHELDAVRAICDRVAVLEAGRVAEEGSVEDVLLKPGSSAAKRLLRSELGAMPVPPEQRHASVHGTSVLLELQMIGAVTSEPILSELTQTYQIEVNILRGHIDQLNTTLYGVLLVRFSGEQQAVRQSIATLMERGIGVVRVNNAGEPQ